MRRTSLILAIVGLVILGTGILLAVGLFLAALPAATLDTGDLNEFPGEAPICPGLFADATLPRRVMSENESQALSVFLRNDGEQPCDLTVSLLGPDFNISPPGDYRNPELLPGEEQTVAWVISPREVGDFELVVSVAARVEVLGVAVTNILGLTAFQARLLSALGTFLGPMLTAPWWFEQWQRWKKARAEKDAEEASHESAASESKTAVPFE